MKYKGTLIVVQDCSRALKFYGDMFGFAIMSDRDTWIKKKEAEFYNQKYNEYLNSYREDD